MTASSFGTHIEDEPMLRCPVCAYQLVEIATATAPVDVCRRCRGMWFDRDELGDLVRWIVEREDSTPVLPQLFVPHAKSAELIQEPTKYCPRCRRSLVRFNYEYDSNVFLDRCPSCSGIWADGGEIRSLTKYLKQDPRIAAIACDLAEDGRQDQRLIKVCNEANAAMRSSLFFAAAGVAILPSVIPLSDSPPSHRPFMTVGLITVNTFLWLWLLLWLLATGGDRAATAATLVSQWGFVPTHWLRWGLLTHMFLHAGPLHLLGNMYFLWLFGDNVEDRLGHLGYLGLYLLCGGAAALCYGLSAWGSQLPMWGASGAVSGVMGAYFALYPSATIKTLFTIFFTYRIIHVPAWFWLGGWFFLQLILGLSSSSGTIAHVAWWAHIGGFAVGWTAAVIYARRGSDLIQLGNSR